MEMVSGETLDNRDSIQTLIRLFLRLSYLRCTLNFIQIFGWLKIRITQRIFAAKIHLLSIL